MASPYTAALAALLVLGVGMVAAHPLPHAHIHPHERFNATAPANCNWGTYKQCDSRWGNQRLGTSGQTICQAGCAMSSVAMFLTGRGKSYDPSTLNAWLINHGGYVQGDELVWSSVDALGSSSFQGIETPSVDTLSSGLSQCHGLVANVRGGSHWVLLTDYRGSSIFGVHDPGFSQDTYPFSEMERVAVYH